MNQYIKQYRDIKNANKRKHNSKKPWYILTKAEMKKMPANIVHKKLGRAAFMEAVVQEKYKKWERKHPRPKDDDLFKDQYLPEWEKEREKALIHIRDFVVSAYDKVAVCGKGFKKHVDYCLSIIETVTFKDKSLKGHNVRYPYLRESDSLYKKAQKFAYNMMNHNNQIVCCDLYGYKRDFARPILLTNYKQAS